MFFQLRQLLVQPGQFFFVFGDALELFKLRLLVVRGFAFQRLGLGVQGVDLF